MSSKKDRFARVVSRWLCKGYRLPAATDMLASMLFQKAPEKKVDPIKAVGETELFVDVETAGSGFPIAFKVPIPNTGTFEATAVQLAALFRQSVAPPLPQGESGEGQADPKELHYYCKDVDGEMMELFPHTNMVAFVWPDLGCKILWITRRANFPVGRVIDTTGDSLVSLSRDQRFIVCVHNPVRCHFNDFLLEKVSIEGPVGDVLVPAVRLGVAKIRAMALNLDSTVLVTINAGGQIQYYRTDSMKQVASGSTTGSKHCQIVTNAQLGPNGLLARPDTMILSRTDSYRLQSAKSEDGKLVDFEENTREIDADPHHQLTHVHATTVIMWTPLPYFIPQAQLVGYNICSGRRMFVMKSCGSTMLNWDGIGSFSTITPTKDVGIKHIDFYKVVLASPHACGVKLGDTMVIRHPTRGRKTLHLSRLVSGWTPYLNMVQIKGHNRIALVNLDDKRLTILVVSVYSSSNRIETSIPLAGNRLLVQRANHCVIEKSAGALWNQAGSHW